MVPTQTPSQLRIPPPCRRRSLAFDLRRSPVRTTNGSRTSTPFAVVTWRFCIQTGPRPRWLRSLALPSVCSEAEVVTDARWPRTAQRELAKITVPNDRPNSPGLARTPRRDTGKSYWLDTAALWVGSDVSWWKQSEVQWASIERGLTYSVTISDDLASELSLWCVKTDRFDFTFLF